jgi:hypothetical protein
MKTMNDKKTQYDSKDIGEQKKFEEKTALEKNKTENKPKSLFDKKLKITGILFIVIAYVIIFVLNPIPKIDTSSDAINALESGYSTSLSLGTIILDKDKSIESKDYTVVHSSDQQKSKIWVWDYAAEDGDYVQIIVDGHPIGDAFFIKNKPVVFTVPSSGYVRIKGVRDGGGGITYAIKYELNGVTYFNNAPINRLNTYTLLKE